MTHEAGHSAAAFKLGDRVIVGAIYRRKKQHGERASSRAYKSWQANPIAPCKALFIGWRTLANGYSTYDSDDVTIFTAEHHFKAALVVFDERTKPVLVPFSTIEIDEASQ